MKILGIESSAITASVAVVEDELMTAEYTINYKKTHSQTLLPMIQEVSKIIELELDSIDAIAVSGGPGSFTGLRIGSATAKGLGLALNKPLIHIPTLDALAYNMYMTGNSVICPIMDARRNQVYTGIYAFENGKFTVLREQCAVSIDEIIEELNTIGREVIFLGDAVKVQADKIKSDISVKYSFAPAHMSMHRAGSVAALGAVYYAEGKIETAAEHEPDYLRLSQAERELAEKNREKGNV